MSGVVELCPDCGAQRYQRILDLSKCLSCGATWVTGQSTRRSLAAVEAARQQVIEDAVALVESGRLDPDEPILRSVETLVKEMRAYYG